MALIADPLSKICDLADDFGVAPSTFWVFVVVVPALQFTVPAEVTLHCALALCGTAARSDNATPMSAVNAASRHRRSVRSSSDKNRRKHTASLIRRLAPRHDLNPE